MAVPAYSTNPILSLHSLFRVMDLKDDALYGIAALIGSKLAAGAADHDPCAGMALNDPPGCQARASRLRVRCGMSVHSAGSRYIMTTFPPCHQASVTYAKTLPRVPISAALRWNSCTRRQGTIRGNQRSVRWSLICKSGLAYSARDLEETAYRIRQLSASQGGRS